MITRRALRPKTFWRLFFFSSGSGNAFSNSFKPCSNVFPNFISFSFQNIYTLFPKEGDAKIADAILELFRKRENIEIFNKKALYIYIREIIDVKTPKITKIANKLYNMFKIHYYFYLENGYTNFP